MYGAATAIVTVSEAISASIAALDSRLVCDVIPDASSKLTFDLERARAIRASFGAEFVVGHIGALDDSHKGQRQIIAIADSIRAVANNISFVMVGSGRDESALKGIAEGISNVFFTGQVGNVGDHMAAFDVFLYPSRHEGLGSILLDALEFGLPIVATNVGGIPEVVEDELNGFLCEVDDVQTMSEAVLTLSRDPGLRARIAEVNRKKAEQYSPGQMTVRYVELYQRLLSSMEQEKAVV
jgi:glycosyltransferase involved in cell wall biosynthesis